MKYISRSGDLFIKTLKNLKKNGLKHTEKKVLNKVINKIISKYNVEIDNSIKADIQLEKIQEQGAFCQLNNGFFSFYEGDRICNEEAKVKTLAFYLPQFHTFPENDNWWGKGFTEWTNTKKSAPRYRAHYQPREPHDDIGYYDLSKVESIAKQAKLAKDHGIFGFCMYYYWFSGKTLMETPLELLRTHKEIDINYCLCWANESWTRTWDGLQNNILIEQKYSEDDKKNFIKDIEKYIKDERYIKHEGKPVIVVYNAGDIPEIKDVFTEWKKTALECGIGEISIWICRSFNNGIEKLELDDLVDKEIEFPPHNLGFKEIANLDMTIDQKGSFIWDYTKLVDLYLNKEEEEISDKLCRSVMLGWDNSARRAEGFNSFDNFSIHKYYQWLRKYVDETVKKHDADDRYVFINAWNEWAEGTYLEPDKKYGYSYLNVTSNAICQKSFYMEDSFCRNDGIKSRIAVQAHIFYIELAEEIISYMNNIPESFDCYITTDSISKANMLKALFKTYCNANRVYVMLCENKGRDVAPFLMQLQGRADKYDYICHIHSKRSLHNGLGEKWRTYLFSNLLGSGQSIGKIFEAFDTDKEIGMIYPETFDDLKKFFEWGSNKEIASNLLKKLNIEISLDDELDFPAGNMLWFRTKAVSQLFDNNFEWEDFPEEDGQLDGTIMHAVERLWGFIINYNGYKKVCMNPSNIQQHV